jgi:hypothetical protein
VTGGQRGFDEIDAHATACSSNEPNPLVHGISLLAGVRSKFILRTVPVKYSAGPRAEGCEPFRLMSIS